MTPSEAKKRLGDGVSRSFRERERERAFRQPEAVTPTQAKKRLGDGTEKAFRERDAETFGHLLADAISLVERAREQCLDSDDVLRVQLQIEIARTLFHQAMRVARLARSDASGLLARGSPTL